MSSATLEIPIPASVPVLGEADFTTFWQQRRTDGRMSRCMMSWLETTGIATSPAYPLVRGVLEEHILQHVGERMSPYQFQCDHGRKAAADVWNKTWEHLGYKREGNNWRH